MNNKVNWIDMFPDEFFDARNHYPVCYMAYGLAEPHGAYSTLGQDWLREQLTMERAAAEYGGIIAPPFVWHINEQPYYDWETDCCGMGMSLSSSIPEALFLHNMLYHIRNMDSKGFHAGILLSGHALSDLGEDMRLLCEFYKRRTGSPIQFWAGMGWELMDEESMVPDKAPSDGGHAGVIEIAQMMELKPEAVDLSRLHKPLNVPEQIAGGNAEFGYYCAPGDFGINRLPTRGLGKQIVTARVKRIGELGAELLSLYKPAASYKYPSVTDTEDIWTRFANLTRKYWGCVRTRHEAENDLTPPPFPGWEALGE